MKNIKAWAVIDKDGPFVSQPYAIYPFVEGKKVMWNKKLLKKFKAKVIQVLITPIKPKRK